MLIKFLDGSEKEFANLQNANLQDANLRNADLQDANLWYANLRCANLQNANLRNADLRYANLQNANLRNADLQNANLQYANLRNADLQNADLQNADLQNANLQDANLWYANLRCANLPSPSVMLLANWPVSDIELICECMKYDAANHPNPEQFNEWKETNNCPYWNVKIQRCVNFNENRKLWSAELLTQPVLSAYELMKRLIVHCCKDSDFHSAHME